MNIYQKLIEVRKSCKYLKKDNTGYKFDFVSSSQTLGSLRKAMDEQGLLLIPTVHESEIRDHATKQGAHEYFTILKMSFTWVNSDKPDEKINCLWTGQGLDSGEKGVGKALTYAEKYFLLKFFNIATDKDDPDGFQDNSQKASGKPYKAQTPKQVSKPTSNQEKATNKEPVRKDNETMSKLDQQKQIHILCDKLEIDCKRFIFPAESTKDLTYKQANDMRKDLSKKVLGKEKGGK